MSSKKVQVKKGNSARSRSLHLSGTSHVSLRKRVPLSVRRRKIRILILVLTTIALITLIGLLSWVSRHPRITVNEVSVVGAKELPEKVLEAFAEKILNEHTFEILSRKNIFLYPKTRIESDIIENFPRAMTASVSLASIRNPSLVLTVEERIPYALWCDGSDCYLTDNGGFIFSEADGSFLLRNMYIFKGGIVLDSPIGIALLPNHFRRITKLLNDVEGLGMEVDYVEIVNDTYFEIVDTEGMALRINFSQTNDEVVSNLKAIMGSSALRDQDIDYIDLRFGNRVYYKLE